MLYSQAGYNGLCKLTRNQTKATVIKTSHTMAVNSHT
jgi:hypothetical protein